MYLHSIVSNKRRSKFCFSTNYYTSYILISNHLKYLGATFTSTKSSSTEPLATNMTTVATSETAVGTSIVTVAVPTVLAFALITISLIVWFAYRRNLNICCCACPSRIARNRVTLRRGKIIVKHEPQDRRSAELFSDSLKLNGNRNSRLRSPIPSYMLDQGNEILCLLVIFN